MHSSGRAANPVLQVIQNVVLKRQLAWICYTQCSLFIAWLHTGWELLSLELFDQFFEQVMMFKHHAKSCFQRF